MLHLYVAVRQYGYFGQQFFSMKSTSSFQCITSVYEAGSLLLDVWSMLPFGTRRITTIKVVFCNTGTLLLALMPVRSAKSVAGRLLPHLPFFSTF